MTEAYPLQWPDGWPRTSSYERRMPGDKFGRYLTIAKARDRLISELRLLGVDDWDIVISSNLELRNDGLPRSQQRRISDPGVAVYFTRDGTQLCMAHDLWNAAEANINALALAISGLRQMERHGGAQMVERAFTGFAALPPPITGARPWYEILEISPDASFNDIQSAYRRKAYQNHPDKGGDAEAMAAVNAAYQQATEGRA